MAKRATSRKRGRTGTGGKQSDTRPDFREQLAATAAPQTDDIEQSEENLFESMADDSYVVVRRKDPNTKQPVFLFRLAPEECNEEIVQRYAGGGAYQLREKVRDSDTGRFEWGRSRTVYIAGEPKRVTELPPSSSRELAPAIIRKEESEPESGGRTTFDDAMLTAVLSVFKAQSDASAMQMKAVEAAMMKMLMPTEGVPWDKILVAAAPILTVLLSRDKREDVDVLSVIEKVTSLLKQEGGLSPSAAFKEQLEVLNEFMDLKERSAPITDDPVLSLAKENLPKLIKLMQVEQERRKRLPTPDELQTAARAALPKAHPMEQQAPVGEAAAAPVPMWKQLLLTQKRTLLRQAMTDKDPVLAADWLAENLPDLYRGSVKQLLLDEQVMESVLGTLPELAEYPQWTEQFFSRLAANVLPAEGEEEEEEEPEQEEPEEEE